MKKLLMVLLLGVLMLGLFGCSKGGKYNVDYDGQKAFYLGAEDSYEAGETVRLEYGPTATDTDYHFTINVDSYSCQGENDYVTIEFVMPAHDVVIKCEFENTMANRSE